MQGLNIKKLKLIELQITQCKHPKDGVDVIISKLNNPKKYTRGPKGPEALT